MRCCLLLLLLLVLGLHEIWDLTGLNFERSSWHTFGISISLNKCAIWREDYSFCFIDKKPPSRTRNWLGVINAIYLGVVSQQGIKPNNQLETTLECNTLITSSNNTSKNECLNGLDELLIWPIMTTCPLPTSQLLKPPSIWQILWFVPELQWVI